MKLTTLFLAAALTLFTAFGQPAVASFASTIPTVQVQSQAQATEVSITTTSLPKATELVAYSATVSATGGTAPYKFEAVNLPHGIVISATTGVLSGIPTVSGAFEITVVAVDSERYPRWGIAKLSLTVVSNIASVTIVPITLPVGTVNQPYGSVNTTLMADGGVTPYTWKETGTLPTGITFATDGVFTGTPTQAGTFPISVTVSDSETPAKTASASYTITINSAAVTAPSITTTSLPGATQGTAYSDTLTATNGTTPYTWKETGALPAGVSFSTAGVLSGTPTNSGSFPLTFTVTDSETPAKTASVSLTLTVTVTIAPLSITSITLPNGTTGTAYPTEKLTANGGVTPYTWSESGALPAGIVFSTSGVFSGTPTTSGTFPVTVTVTDSETPAKTATISLSITIAATIPTLDITTTSVPTGTEGKAYSLTFTATGGSGTDTWSETGTLPTGITLSSAGALTGTPPNSGSFPITVTVKDSEATPQTASASFTITIASNVATLAISTTSIPGGTEGTAYSDTLTASGGTTPYTWSATGVPAGLTLSTAGVLSGTPTASGTFTVDVTVTDSEVPAKTATAVFTISIATNISVAGAPNCGLLDDGLGHMPSDWATFTPPAVGGTYKDALGGCVVKRLTTGGDTAHYYSTLEAMDFSDTYVFVAGAGTCGSGGGWCIINLNGGVVVSNANMPSATNPTQEYYWSGNTGGLFYYTNKNSLMSGTVVPSTGKVTIATVYTFSQYSYISLPDETRVSLDGTTIGIVGEHLATAGVANADIFSFNLETLTQSYLFTTTLGSASGDCDVYAGSEYSGSGAAPFNLGVTDIVGGCIHKIIMSTDNRVEVEWHSNKEPKLDAACISAFAAGDSCKSIITASGTLVNMQSGTTHTDSFLSAAGDDMYFSLWDPSPNGSNDNDPCPSHGGHSSMNDQNNAVTCVFTTVFTGGHISTAGSSPSQPWMLIAYDDTSRPKSPEWWTTSSNYVAPTNTSCSQYTSAGSAFPGNCWFPYESEMILVNINSVGNTNGLGGTKGDIYRIAWSRTRDDSQSFWGQQRASLSRDGKYIVFSSNMAYPSGSCGNPTDLACDDVYLIGPLF